METFASKVATSLQHRSLVSDNSCSRTATSLGTEKIIDPAGINWAYVNVGSTRAASVVMPPSFGAKDSEAYMELVNSSEMLFCQNHKVHPL